MTGKTFNIVALPGDGIGPELMQAALPLLDVIQKASGVQFTVQTHVFGGACIDQHGEPVQASTVKAAEGCDAILLGSVGGPKWDNNQRERRPEWGIFTLRKHFQLYANIRPASILSDKLLDLSPLKPDVARGANIITVRENAGGIYFGKKVEPGEQSHDYASDECAYTRDEIVRLTRVAATLALQHSPPLPVHSVDKANAMASSRLWRKVVTETINQEFPQLAATLTHSLVDSCAMVIARRPTQLNGVLLTENLFGDILSDLAAVIPGSLGLLGSGELDGPPPSNSDDGSQRRPFGMYQPVSGSAPDIAGKDIANPIGMLSSVAMMLRWSFGLRREADCIDAALKTTIERGICTRDLGGQATTLEAAKAVCDEVLLLLSQSTKAEATHVKD